MLGKGGGQSDRKSTQIGLIMKNEREGSTYVLFLLLLLMDLHHLPSCIDLLLYSKFQSIKTWNALNYWKIFVRFDLEIIYNWQNLMHGKWELQIPISM